MKAILVVDMPKSCEDCELCRDGYLCLRLGEVDESVENGTKDLRCPLKPLPQRKMVGEIKEVDDFMKSEIEIINEEVTATMMLDTELLIASGYNLCIDEILGEKE